MDGYAGAADDRIQVAPRLSIHLGLPLSCGRKPNVIGDVQEMIDVLHVAALVREAAVRVSSRRGMSCIQIGFRFRSG